MHCLASKPGSFLKRTVLFAILILPAAFASAATNDLVITSITKQDECVTLNWRSHPDEFYTVYWTDVLGPNIFWRVAEVKVPSGGTNTVWTDGTCSQSMMAGPGSGAGGLESTFTATKAVASPEEVEALKVKYQDFTAPDFIYPPGHPKAPKVSAVKKVAAVSDASGLLAESELSSGGGTMAMLSSPATTHKFYRVARTAVLSRVAGWGVGVGTMPAGLTNVIDVSAGCAANVSHSLGLRADGSVVAWGANFYGQTNVPADVSDAVAVAAGGHHSLALLRDGSVRAWGNNGLGQTNLPAGLENVADVKAGCWHSIALKADGTVMTWGYLYSNPANASNAVPSGLSNVTAIAAGALHCMALKSDGTVTAWGFSPPIFAPFLPTNVPPGLSNVIAISAGQEHSQALLRDGRIVVWGNSNDPAVSGIPGALTNSGASVATMAAGWLYGLAVKSNATVEPWGRALSAPVPFGLTNVWTVSAGSLHALALLTNNLPIINQDPKSQEVGAGTFASISVMAREHRH